MTEIVSRNLKSRQIETAQMLGQRTTTANNIAPSEDRRKHDFPQLNYFNYYNLFNYLTNLSWMMRQKRTSCGESEKPSCR